MLSVKSDGVVHQGDLWGRAGSSIPRLPFDYAQGKRSAQELFVCGKFIGEPAPTGDQNVQIMYDLPKNLKFKQGGFINISTTLRLRPSATLRINSGQALGTRVICV